MADEIVGHKTFSVPGGGFRHKPLTRSEAAAQPIPAEPVAQTAKQQFDELMQGLPNESPLENLRFFCSLAMNGQDWLDVEPFFDAVESAPPIPASQWLPIETAPKDGTLVLLLLAHDNDFDNGIEAEEEHQPRTIGHNNFEHDGTDRWQFAGWNWEQDCYTEGWGTPIAWMPLPAAPAPKEGA